FVEQGLGVVVFRHDGIVLPALVAPAKPALEVAGIDRRRHLEASVAFDAVEPTLVAVPAARERFPGPVAELDGTVSADQLVTLADELRGEVLVAHSTFPRPRFDP